MYVYLPEKKQDKAPIVVAIHYCGGSATAYFTFNNNKYATLADTKGYIVIYPSAPSSGGCWDVASKQSLTHNGGGDSQTIVNMVKYAVDTYGGDPDRVFATGTSSGAMMANVLAGAYPDVFKGVTAYSGVADGCFYVSGATAGMSSPGWNNACANGQSSKTAQAWGDLARSYYPGYTGSYPKVMIWHGTADTTLRYPNYAEMLKQWSNVLAVDFSKNVSNTPEAKYTESVYGDGTKLLGFSAQGVGHNVPIHEQVELDFWGI
ncbi:putative Acetylxylan esterase A [Lasiosphaeria ovina]|uniref:Carboxylic ester hydrolase n=1 Tax=Lasiosphaeria ovina TaxID=92902 RepID=A0AAE0JSD6_9PEZI|nr:putative Acetylxylan esterase A [Lasiosphaeria ovina]